MSPRSHRPLANLGPESYAFPMPGPWDRYRQISQLGEGGMGVVWLAEQISTGKHVAIKLLHPLISVDSQLLRRFSQEARAILKVEHENIVRLLDFDLDPAEPYLVLEYVEGEGTLANVLDSGTLNLEESLVISMELASGVAHLHDRGLIHRDLKPSNILMDGGRHPRICDLGLARFIGGIEALQTRHTLSGQALGTPAYMAPEIIDGFTDADERSDVYSLGLIVDELVRGRLTFSQGDRMQNGELPIGIVARLRGEIPGIQSENPAVPMEIERLIFKSHEVKPQDRQASAVEFLHELTEAVARMHGVSDAVKTHAFNISQVLSRPKKSGESPPQVKNDERTIPMPTPGRRRSLFRRRWKALALGSWVGLSCILTLLVANSWPSNLSSHPMVTGPSLEPARPLGAAQVAEIAALQAQLKRLSGSNGAELTKLMESLHATWRRIALSVDSPDLLAGAPEIEPLRKALKSVPGLSLKELTSGDQPDRELIGGLQPLWVLDEFAVSLGQAKVFGPDLERILGPYSDQCSFPELTDRAAKIFGYHALSSVKAPLESGTWQWKLPQLADGDVDLLLVCNGLDPKVLIRVVINRSHMIYLRNRDAIAGGRSYEVPTFQESLTGNFVSFKYTPDFPFGRYVVLGRRIPRATLRTGLNDFQLSFMRIPGKLVLPPGKAWKSSESLASGTVWHGYLVTQPAQRLEASIRP